MAISLALADSLLEDLNLTGTSSAHAITEIQTF